MSLWASSCNLLVRWRIQFPGPDHFVDPRRHGIPRSTRKIACLLDPPLEAEKGATHGKAESHGSAAGLRNL